MTAPRIVLVPGFWLGAWAWDEVEAAFRSQGHDVTSVTLPGLESLESDRSAVKFSDHVDTICAAVGNDGDPVVLAVHSGAGAPGYAASDRIPERIAAMVYVDTGPATAPLGPDFEGTELPLPSPEDLAANESLEGLTEEQLETFRKRAIPQPGAALREGPELSNPARLDVPSTVICTSISSEGIKAAVDEGYAWIGGLAELRDVSYVDLPTSHWPMWSRPTELAEIIGGVARDASVA
jgi:pimeloyl-ACP methyl ester carboxylesterase